MYASDGESSAWRTIPRRRTPALWCCRAGRMVMAEQLDELAALH